MTFVGRDEALALLDGFELEMFEEEEADGVTPRGNRQALAHLPYRCAEAVTRPPAS